MLSSNNGRCRGVAVSTAAFLALLGFAAPVIAQEPGGALAVEKPLRLAQAASAKVSYSDDQAERGRDRYDKVCQDCHGKDLKGGMNGGAPLRGGQFDDNFMGAPASALFIYISTLMPPNSPGRFSESNYAELMAYVLKRNGFQPGAPLPSDIDALDNLFLEK